MSAAHDQHAELLYHILKVFYRFNNLVSQFILRFFYKQFCLAVINYSCIITCTHCYTKHNTVLISILITQIWQTWISINLALLIPWQSDRAEAYLASLSDIY